MFLLYISRIKTSCGVKGGDEGNAHVGEYRKPHVGYANGTEHQYDRLNGKGKDDVLLNKAHGLFGDFNAERNFRGIVVHEDDVGRLNRGVGAEGTHGDTHIGA